jgi:hypothetical protein
MAEQHLQATPPAPQQDARTDAAGLIDLRLSGACHGGDDGSCAKIAQAQMAGYPRRRTSRTLDLRALQGPRPPSSQRTPSPLLVLTDLNANQRDKDAVAACSSRFRPAKDWETSRNDGNGWGNEPVGREADSGIAAVSEVGLENISR